MYNVSDAFKRAIVNNTRRIKAYILIGEQQHEFRTCTIDDNIYSSETDTFIGTFIAKSGTITFNKEDSLDLENESFILYFGIELEDETVEYLPIGKFHVYEKVSNTEYKIIDNKMYFNYHFDDTDIVYPISLVNYLKEICRQAGVFLSTIDFPNNDLIINKRPFQEGYVPTLCEAVVAIAQASCSFACIDYEGNLEMRWFKETNQTYYVDNQKSYPTISKSYGPVNKLIISSVIENDEGEETTQDVILDDSDSIQENGETRLEIVDNPILNLDKDKFKIAIWNRIKGFSYIPYTANMQGQFHLDTGDIFDLELEDGSIVKVPILNHTLTYSGGISSQMTAEAQSENQINYSQESSENITLRKVVVKFNTEILEVTKELTATKATIKDLDVDSINARFAEIEETQIDTADIETLLAQKAYLNEAQVNTLITQKGYITNLEADTLITEKGYITEANVETLIANKGYITNLEAENLVAGKGYITELRANELYSAKATVNNLEADVGKINTLLAGSVTAGSTETIVLNANNTTIANALIKDAMIDTLSFNKITGIDINTTKLTVHSNDGKSTWKDNTIQIKDSTRTRVQIGKDNLGDYNIYIWDKNGNLMFDPLGLTDKGVTREVIDNSNVKENAGIHGSKLDIDSVIREVNDNGTTTIKSSKIYFNEDKQTLDVVLNSMTGDIEANSTAINVANGNISSLITRTTQNEADIGSLETDLGNAKANITNLTNNYNSVKDTVDSHTQTIGQHTSSISNLTTTANNALTTAQNATKPTTYLNGNYTTKTYYEIGKGTKAYTSTSAVGSIRIYGSIGGWTASNNGGIDITCPLRDNLANIVVQQKESKIGTTACDIWITYDSGGIPHYYLVLSGYASATLYVVYNPTYFTLVRTTSTTAPTGTVVWKLSEKTSITDVISANVTTVTDRVATVEQSLDGFKTTVSNTYATKTQLNSVDGKFANYSTTTAMNSAIQQSASSIETKVSNTYTTKSDFNGVKTRVTNAESLISQNANNIALKVSKDGIISSINQTSEEVKIQANKIKFEGLVTANNNFKILEDGSIETVNGKFSGMINAESGTIAGWTIKDNAFESVVETDNTKSLARIDSSENTILFSCDVTNNIVEGEIGSYSTTYSWQGISIEYEYDAHTHKTMYASPSLIILHDQVNIDDDRGVSISGKEILLERTYLGKSYLSGIYAGDGDYLGNMYIYTTNYLRIGGGGDTTANKLYLYSDRANFNGTDFRISNTRLPYKTTSVTVKIGAHSANGIDSKTVTVSNAVEIAGWNANGTGSSGLVLNRISCSGSSLYLEFRCILATDSTTEVVVYYRNY